MASPSTRPSRNILAAVFGVLILLLLYQARFRQSQSVPSSRHGIFTSDSTSPGGSKVGKISMLYGTANIHYERAIKTHEIHAKRHGYASHVLRNEIVSGYWNKPVYICSLIVQELAKSPADRVEWFMWYDADSILINPDIPAEVFLPPTDFEDIHLIANKDHLGLNTGIFFIHVHEWSVNLLTKSIALSMYKPDLELGPHPDQTGMSYIFQDPSFRSGIVYQPRPWANTYEFVHGYEGKKGDMLVHFPGMRQLRWQHMEKWLKIVETTPEEWKLPLAKTDYPQKIAEYWQRLRSGRLLMQQAKAKFEKNGNQDLLTAIEKLNNTMEAEADKENAVKDAMEEVRKFLDTPTNP